MHLEKAVGMIQPRISLKLHILACCCDRVMRVLQVVTVTLFLYEEIYIEIIDLLRMLCSRRRVTVSCLERCLPAPQNVRKQAMH